jgi:hypothetical protein
MTEREEIHTYYDGVKEGLWKYAWWKNGVQYVGNMGTTLKEAIAKVDEEKKKALKGAFE